MKTIITHYNDLKIYTRPAAFVSAVKVEEGGFDIIGFVRKYFGERCLLLVVARKKYVDWIGQRSEVVLDVSYVKRIETLPYRIAGLLSRVYFYKDRMVPNAAKALYMVPSPSPHRAAFIAMKEIMERWKRLLNTVYNGNTISEEDWLDLGNLPRHVKHALHVSGEAPYFIFDIDTTNKETYVGVMEVLQQYGIKPTLIYKTRGGYHLMVEKKRYGEIIHRNKVHEEIKCRYPEVEFLKVNNYLLPHAPHGGGQVELV